MYLSKHCGEHLLAFLIVGGAVEQDLLFISKGYWIPMHVVITIITHTLLLVSKVGLLFLS